MNFIYFKKKISNLIYRENAVVRKTFKWQFRFFIFLNFIVFLFILANFFFTVGEKNHDFNRKNYEKKIITLNKELADKTVINDDLNNRIIELQHRNNVLDALNKDMLVSLRLYQDEKINLLETVDFYETLMKNDSKKSGLNVLKFKAYKNKATNDIIYTMLITCVKDKIFKFDGFYNFNIELIDKMGTKNLIYPRNEQKIKLDFKYFSRVEGKIKLSNDVIINSIKVQLFDDVTDNIPSYSSSFRIGKI